MLSACNSDRRKHYYDVNDDLLEEIADIVDDV